MSEMKSLTLNDKTYDCFVDSVARSQVEATTVVNSASGETIALSDASNYRLLGLHIYGKTTQDGTPTPEAPVDIVSAGDTGSIEGRVIGKNILPLPYRDGPTKTVNGLTFSVNDDGSVSVSGTATENANFFFTSYNFALKKGVTYTVSLGDMIIASNAYLWIATDTKETIVGINLNNARSAVFTPKNDVHSAAVYIYVDAGGSVSGVLYPQIENGAKATNYERYKAQVMAVSTPSGLAGIPVTSGGNYTDANGQQWVCDEVDLARGVCVLRTGLMIFTASTAYSDFIASNGTVSAPLVKPKPASMALCTHAKKGIEFDWVNDTDVLFRVSHFNVTTLSEFKEFVQKEYNAGNPVTIRYMLATPVEIPLSEAERAAYAALHTYRGNTTVTNDASAHMELEYVMDAKKYIDSQISAGILAATVE